MHAGLGFQEAPSLAPVKAKAQAQTQLQAQAQRGPWPRRQAVPCPWREAAAAAEACRVK